MTSCLLFGLSACDLASQSEEPSSNAEIKSRTQEVLGSQVTAFQVREINVAELTEQLQAGEAPLPIATPDTEVVEMTLGARVDEGILRQGPETAERAPLPPERSFFVGACSNGGGELPCGGLTVLYHLPKIVMRSRHPADTRIR